MERDTVKKKYIYIFLLGILCLSHSLIMHGKRIKSKRKKRENYSMRDLDENRDMESKRIKGEDASRLIKVRYAEKKRTKTE